MKTGAELVNDGGEFGPALLGGCDGVIKISNAFRQVGAIDIEGNRDLSEGRPRRPERRSASAAIRRTSAGSKYLDCHALSGLDVIADHALISGEALIEGREIPLMIMVDEDSIDLTHGVIAGSASYGPTGWQLLAGLQDLLHRDPLLCGKGSKSIQIVERVPQAVGVIDTQPGDAVFTPCFGSGHAWPRRPQDPRRVPPPAW